MNVLIFIVAYNAEKTIKEVLTKIPDELWDKYDIDILIIDDCSADNTFYEGLKYVNSTQYNSKIKILKNPVNQGYGGNQKLGYHFAIKNGYDVVALLHGDGQYSPAILPYLIEPVSEHRADAVFGSRMMTRGAALKGGMPLYKYIGNRILTWYENLLLNASLSEFHSGYRIYNVQALKQIPFEYNTNDFHFDTEIIIQLFNAGFEVSELPIPTYYGDEICHVNGLKYAYNVIKAVTLNKMQDWGVLYDRKFDCRPENNDNREYTFKQGFTSSHTVSISAIKPHSAVLDLGCGAGHIGGYLQKNKFCHVVGVDKEPIEPSTGLKHSIVHDLNELNLPVKIYNYDYVLLLDIIEHLNQPESFMEHIRESSKGNSNTLIHISVPNVAFFIVRLMLLLGKFNYGKRGILDLTHTRLFTFKSLQHFLIQTGFDIISIKGIPAPLPLRFGNGVLGKVLLRINQMAIRVCKGLFSYQIFAIVKPLPTVSDLLEETVQHTNDYSTDQSLYLSKN